MYNSSIFKLEKQIIEAINNSNLHVGTILLVIDKITTSVRNSFEEQVKKEQIELSNTDNSDLTDMIEIDNNLVD